MSNKSSDCVQVNLRITTNSNQGGRRYMEDAYTIALQRLNPSDKESPISLAYFGVFDGHGGKEAAEFARQHLRQHILEQDEFWPDSADENQNDQSILSAIRKGFLACHNDMWNHVDKWTRTSSGLPSTSGSTASVAFIRGKKLYIGHVGDSAIVLGEGDSLYKPWSVNRLTRDHKPEDPLELKRIQDSGGNVLCKAGVHRVVWNRQKVTTSHQYRHRQQHSITTTTTTVVTTTETTTEYEQIPFLAVSRALGDLWSLNRTTNLYSVSPEPELTVIELDPSRHRCLILASDGLWNMMTPEAAVDIVRNCDIKTEEMLLKSEDDDHRPFRNPSHELVQKALALWRERMLRSDNITCVTVMLDPLGLPFGDCVVKKKKERLDYTMSSSTNSICSDDTVEFNDPSPVTSTTVTSAAAPRCKPTLERTEHILTPILNGPTPVRAPKRPASDDVSTLIVDNPRHKLRKTDRQKENGRTSSTNESVAESETASSFPQFRSEASPSPSTDADTHEQEPACFIDKAAASSSSDGDNLNQDEPEQYSNQCSESSSYDRFVEVKMCSQNDQANHRYLICDQLSLSSVESDPPAKVKFEDLFGRRRQRSVSNTLSGENKRILSGRQKSHSSSASSLDSVYVPAASFNDSDSNSTHHTDEAADS